MRIVALSGEIATGKSSIAEVLCTLHAFTRIRTSAYLQKEAAKRNFISSRETLQMLGAELDVATNGEWVVEATISQLALSPEKMRWLLDSVRIPAQLSHLRAKYSGKIVHAHIFAHPDAARRRFENRKIIGGEYSASTSYDTAKSDPTEMQVSNLAGIADLIVDTSTASPTECAQIIARETGL